MTGIEAAIFACENALSFKEGFSVAVTVVSLVLAGYAIILANKSISDAKSFKEHADRVNASTTNLLIDIKHESKLMKDWGMERIKANDDFKENLIVSSLTNQITDYKFTENQFTTNKIEDS